MTSFRFHETPKVSQKWNSRILDSSIFEARGKKNLLILRFNNFQICITLPNREISALRIKILRISSFQRLRNSQISKSKESCIFEIVVRSLLETCSFFFKIEIKFRNLPPVSKFPLFQFSNCKSFSIS